MANTLFSDGKQNAYSTINTTPIISTERIEHKLFLQLEFKLTLFVTLMWVTVVWDSLCWWQISEIIDGFLHWKSHQKIDSTASILKLSPSLSHQHKVFSKITFTHVTWAMKHPYVNLWWKDKNEEILNDPSSSVTEFSLEDETEQRSSKVIDDKSNEVIRNSKRSFRQDSYEITIHGHRRSNEVTLDSAVSTPLSVSASPMMKRNCWIYIYKNASRPSDSSLNLVFNT